MSGFIKIGKVNGVLAEHENIYAPDRGLHMGLHHNKLRTHFHGFGKTSCGMTFNPTPSTLPKAMRRFFRDRNAIQARWDERRSKRERRNMERATAPALGASRRQGRL